MSLRLPTGCFPFLPRRVTFRPILALERLSLLEGEGKVGYRHGEKGAELETMDYLEFIARGREYLR